VVRRAAILDTLGDFPPGNTLEMGCGSGALLHDLEKRGCHGKGVDRSEHALAIGRHLWGGDERAFKIAPELTADDIGVYDYLMAFEVLEHIDDDIGTLREWSKCLKSGGTLIISVPAHRRLWGTSDEWAGHCRRYDHADVLRLVTSAGFTPTLIRSYGFPILNVLLPISNLASRRKLAAKSHEAATTIPSEATARSGADRRLESKLFWLYSNILSKFVFTIACRLQRAFYNTRLGTGFLVVASQNGGNPQ
jgi:SAM-dependent methyltransferase